MPNRLIEGSIHTSDKVNAMTDFQFRVWVNLITYVDDYGRGDARPAVIKGTCFPLRERLTNRDIEAALSALSDIGCVGLYEVDGKPYLYLINWESHQRIRKKVSKFPPPPNGGELQQMAASCGELQQMAASCGLNPIRIQSESRIQNPESRIQNPKEEDQERAREGWDEFVKTYENNLGLLPRSEVELSDLRMFFDEFGAEAICELIRQSARKHPDNPHTYFSAICRKHLGKGIKTAEQVKAAFMDFDRKHGKGRDAPVNELVYADEDDFY